MKRTILICTMFVVLLTGCTTKSNEIADEAFSRAIKQQQTITNDLFTMVMQSVTDRYCASARTAATSGDADAAAQAVKDALYACDQVTWLTREQQLLTYELFRISRRYIWEQRGWGSILWRDWQEAKLRVDEEQPSGE